MSHDTRWDAWTPDEEMLYLEFARSHVDNTPWPIKQMSLAAVTRKLNCRPFTQHVLELKALLEWKKKQAKKGMEEGKKREEEKNRENDEKGKEEKRMEIPEIHITTLSGASEYYMPSASQEDSTSSIGVPMDSLTASEWSIFNEFANIQQRRGGIWPVEQMDDLARERGLVCRPFTQEMLDHEFKNHPRYRPPKPAHALGKKPQRKVLTLAEARQKSTGQAKGAVEDGDEPRDG